MSLALRQATPADNAATRALVRAAFAGNEPEETAAFLDALRAEGCALGEWLAEDAGGVAGHVVFSRVHVGTVPATMLTPLAVRPDRQRQGVGTALTRHALAALEATGERHFLVLGHPAYYPRFGFRVALAEGIAGPWSAVPASWPVARPCTARCGCRAPSRRRIDPGAKDGAP